MSKFGSTIEQWWAEAEIATEDKPVRYGDRIIAKFGEGDFRIVTDSLLLTGPRPFEYRVLERAPKWTRARAVLAVTVKDHDDVARGVFERIGRETWRDTMGNVYKTADLDEVTPFITAEPSKYLADKLYEEFNGDITWDDAWNILENIFADEA